MSRLTDLDRQRIKNVFRNIPHERRVQEAAKALAWFIEDGVKRGLPPEAAFEAAREHMRLQAKAMIEVADAAVVEVRGSPPPGGPA